MEENFKNSNSFSRKGVECEQCGKQLKSGEKFCPSCGSKATEIKNADFKESGESGTMQGFDAMFKNLRNDQPIDLLLKFRVFLIVAALIIFGSIFARYFLTFRNIGNLIRQIPMYAIPAAGLCVVMLTGGVDLSVGAVMGFVGAVTAIMANGNISIIFILPAAVIIGVIIGAINGVLVSQCKLHPVIITLGTQFIFRGASFLLLDGRNIPIHSRALRALGQGSLLYIIPYSLIVTAFVYALAFGLVFALSSPQKRYDRYLFAAEGDVNAAKPPDADVSSSSKMLAYMSCGVFAAIAGVLMVSRMSAAIPSLGIGYEMYAIAAVVIGGTSLRSGEDRDFFAIICSFGGALVIVLLSNIVALLNISPYAQNLIMGIVLILAALLTLLNPRANRVKSW